MNDTAHPQEDRLNDLLAAYAVEGLSQDERDELKRLLADAEGVRPEEFETAAAAIHLALAGPVPSMPDALAERILADASTAFPVTAAVEETAPRVQATLVQPARPEPTRAESVRPREVLAWAAAVLSMVVTLMVVSNNKQKGEPAVPTVAEARAALLSETDTVTVTWKALDDPTAAGASGDVVWNDRLAQGFMRFRNLQPNQPSEFQYQLWIFESPDQKYPIDGGVFDITAADQIVPIRPGILPEQALQFAITIEKPGGVVVSDRERIPLLAAL